MILRTLISSIRGHWLVSVIIVGLLLADTVSEQRVTSWATAVRGASAATLDGQRGAHFVEFKVTQAEPCNTIGAAREKTVAVAAHERFAEMKHRQAMQVADAATSWIDNAAADTLGRSHAWQRFTEMKQRQAERHDTATR